jgi:hypothetical protein
MGWGFFKKECSFLKKRTKKLLRTWPGLSGEAAANVQKFFASFFQKRSPSLNPKINHPQAFPGRVVKHGPEGFV